MPVITVGRIVHYFTTGEPGEEPQAALVVKKWSDDCVNLDVLADGSGREGGIKTSVC